MDELSNALSTLTAAIIFIAIGAVVYHSMDGSFSFNTINSIESESIAIHNKSSEYAQISLIKGQHIALVKKHCLGCHSDKLISQNRMTRERWKETIVWMQETQGLWQMGKDEAKVLDYLATNYGPVYEGRRKQLEVEEIGWYVLEVGKDK